jgi:ketosteroid isomerase-like protein
MSRQNVDAVRRLLEHFMATMEPEWALLDAEVEVHDHDILDAGDYRGHEGFGRWLEDWGAAWEQYTIEPEEFIDAGEKVLVVLRMKATGLGSGVGVERQDGAVFTLRNGRVTGLEYYNTREQALESAGLADG